MAETVTFANFDIDQGNVQDIGRDTEHARGVLGDIAVAFGGSAEAVGELLSEVAPRSNLQENIAFAHATLSDPKVQEKLGYEPGTNPHQIGHDWAKRAGLQTPVFRPFIEPHTGQMPDIGYYHFDAAVLPDRVVRWMKRMGDVVVEASLDPDITIDELLILPSAHQITEAESSLHVGLTRHQYAAGTLVRHTIEEGTFGLVSITRRQPTHFSGKRIMEEAADFIDSRHDLANPETRILLPTVAGNWMQTGAQARAAFQGYARSFDDTPGNRQLWVRSDAFETDPTGTKSVYEAQNSHSAIGNILRGAKLIQDLQQRA